MKIILAQHYGLCFGVRDAMAQAESLAAAGPLTILGELVHNPVVRERLTRLGVQEAELGAPGTAETTQVMITAHGASDAARAAWRKAGYGVADGTCPLVRHAHQQLQALVALGFQPIIIGQRQHVEVEGLRGDFLNAVVVDGPGAIRDLPQSGRLGIISQTTQPIEKVRVLVEAIRAARPECEIRFVDTVCQPTKNRQSALRSLLEEADTLVVVGGRHSNNTRQLVAAAETAGRAVYHVECADELQGAWFADTNTVGVTAGTSTLKETVAAVVERLEHIADCSGASRGLSDEQAHHVTL